MAFFLAVSLAGVAWLGWGVATLKADSWFLPVGSLCFLFGGLLALLLWAVSRQTNAALGVKRWRRSGLVLGPDGLALVQGDLRGNLRWDEVLNVTLKGRPTGFGVGYERTGRGIHLKVEGAAIVIADVYNRPLHAIYQRILKCWEEWGPEWEDEE
jgi:hypothetical protein